MNNNTECTQTSGSNYIGWAPEDFGELQTLEEFIKDDYRGTNRMLAIGELDAMKVRVREHLQHEVELSDRKNLEQLLSAIENAIAVVRVVWDVKND